MEAAFSAYAGDSDSESIRSDISETFGSGFQRRPGSGRRKARPVRSPFDGYATVSTESQSCCAHKEYIPSRLGLHSHLLEGSSPSLQATSSPSPAPVAAARTSDAAVHHSSGPATSNVTTATTNTATTTTTSRKKTKQDLSGPCCHCGAVQSPQWRKGPKGKPILCNACGIRFLRTRSLGKSMPKKRRAPALVPAPAAAAAGTAAVAAAAPAAAGSRSPADHTDSDTAAAAAAAAQAKRQRTQEAFTEGDEIDLASTEVLATDEMLEDAHSSPISSSHLSSASAAPGSPGHTHQHQPQHTHLLGLQQQHLPLFAARSRLAIATNAAAAAAAAAAAGSGAVQPSSGGMEFCGLEVDAEEDYSQDNEPAALLLSAASTAAEGARNNNNAASASGTPGTTSPAVAAASAAAASAAGAATGGGAGTAVTNTSFTSGTNCNGGFIGLLGPNSSGIQQPLAAGSRHILLGRGTALGSLITSNPSLALSLALHHHQLQQQQQQHQKQPNSPAKVGVSAQAASASPMSNMSTAFTLKFQHSVEHSAASASPPISPLVLDGSQQPAATSGLRASGATGSSSGGVSHQQQKTNHQPAQMQQVNLQGAQPLSLVACGSATAADLSSAASGPAPAPAAPAPAAAAAAAAATGGGQDMLQLINHMANVLGGMGPAFEFLKAISSNAGVSATTGANTAAGIAAAAPAAAPPVAPQ